MKKILIAVSLMVSTVSAWALQPFFAADTKLPGGNVKAVMAAAEQKLTGAGFTVVGHYEPKGITKNATIVVTDAGIVQAAQAIGGTAVVAIPIRVGVKADGTVSYANLEYWGRAFMRKDYGKAEAAIKAASGKLAAAFGSAKPFGGENQKTEPENLASYQYKWLMPDFDNSNLMEYGSFDEALKAVRANLGKGVGQTSKIYELVYADKKIAVFGVGQNATDGGDGAWVNKLHDGADSTVCLPWETFIVDGKVHSFAAEFRIALCWPTLSMMGAGSFMSIMDQPAKTKSAMEDVAGVKKLK
jgi:hypothetical protein